MGIWLLIPKCRASRRSSLSGRPRSWWSTPPTMPRPAMAGHRPLTALSQYGNFDIVLEPLLTHFSALYHDVPLMPMLDRMLIRACDGMPDSRLQAHGPARVNVGSPFERGAFGGSHDAEVTPFFSPFCFHHSVFFGACSLWESLSLGVSETIGRKETQEPLPWTHMRK